MKNIFRLHNPFQFVRTQDTEDTYKEPPETLHQLETEWIAPHHCSKHLREVCQQWYRPENKPLLEDLNLIQWEVIGGDQRIQPYPTVACATYNSVTVGALSGRPNYVHKYFFIEELAIHPGCIANSDSKEMIANALVNLAIDYSMELGFRGWVACDIDLKHLDVLRYNGFYPHDAFTFRKMGYFA